MLGLARRENRLRFSRLKNKHSPKLAPVLRLVSASLRLRYRSAAIPAGDGISRAVLCSRAWRNLVKTHKCILTISLFRCGARSSFEPDGTALRGRRPGDPGGTERYCVSLNQLSPTLRSRACAIQLYSAYRRNSGIAPLGGARVCPIGEDCPYAGRARPQGVLMPASTLCNAGSLSPTPYSARWRKSYSKRKTL